MVGRLGALLAVMVGLSHCSLDDRNVEEHDGNGGNGGTSRGGTRATGGTRPTGGTNSTGGVSTGGTNSTGGTGAVPDDPLCVPAAADDACTLCDKSNCCTEVATCVRSDECGTFLDCLTACAGDDACGNACAEAFPTGFQQAADFALCLDSYCGDQCSA